MNDILVLIDFSEIAPKAVEQAIAIGKRKGGRILLFHIHTSNSNKSEAEIADMMAPYAEQVKIAGLEWEIIFGKGSIFEEAHAKVNERKPALVIAANHGIKSLDHRLGGSAIHKLVQQIEAPTLLLNAASEVKPNGHMFIMLPASPHPDFDLKVKAASWLVADAGKILLYVILPSGAKLDRESEANIDGAKTWLTSEGITWEYKEVEARKHAIGYADQTIDEINTLGMDLISIMARISDRHRHFGKIDKERVLLNEDGFHVLCANGPVLKAVE